jgi:hypothetical protein
MSAAAGDKFFTIKASRKYDLSIFSLRRLLVLVYAVVDMSM